MAITNSNGGAGEAFTEEDDKPSLLGRFSWIRLGKTCIPCLLRNNDEKYVSVRIAEMKVLNNYLQNFNAEMLSCITVKSFRTTKAECSLLNAINYEHSGCAFGKGEFYVDRDYMVKYEDLNEYYNFLETCYSKLMHARSQANDKCGFVRINRESVVPYVIKNNVKYVPLFYFVGEIESLEADAISIERWDLAYLKFCCKVHGIKNEFVASDRCLVTALENIKIYFPEDTTFEDYWPTHIVYTGPTVSRANGVHSWVQMPPSFHAALNSVPTSTYSPMNKPVPAAQPFSAVNNTPKNKSASPYQNRNAYPSNTNVSTMNSGRVAQEMPQTAMNAPPRQNTNQGNPLTVPTSRSYNNQMPKVTHHYFPATSLNTNNPKNGTQLHQPVPTYTVSSSLPPSSYQNHNNMHVQSNTAPPPAYSAAAYRIDNILSNNQCRNQNQNGALNLMSRAPPPPNVSMRKTMVPNDGASDNDIIDLLSPPSSPYSADDSALLPRAATPQHNRNIMPNFGPQPLSQIPEPVYSKTSAMLPHRSEIIPFRGGNILTINKIPFVYKDDVVPLTDVCPFFKTTSADLQIKLQHLLKTVLFKGNRTQMQILQDSNRIRTMDDEVPLILLRDLEHHFETISSIYKTENANFNKETKRKKYT